MFCTHYMHYPGELRRNFAGLELAISNARKAMPPGPSRNSLITKLFGRAMFANRTHGSCTSSAVYLTTCLRALGIPTRMVLAIPMVDGNDQAQLALCAMAFIIIAVRRAALQGLSSAQGIRQPHV